jgi:hypothetical protein
MKDVEETLSHDKDHCIMVFLHSDFVNVRFRFSNRFAYVPILSFTFPRQITKILIMQRSLT